MKIGHLLVRGTNWIGDSVMTLPAIRELRRHLPDTRITLMVRPWVRAMFEGLECIDQLIDCEDRGSQWAKLRANAGRMREGGYDAILLLPNAIAPALQARLAGIPMRMGYATDARGWLLNRPAKRSTRLPGRHQCFHYLSLIHQLGLSPIDYLAEPDCRLDASIPLTDAEHQAAAETCARFKVDPAVTLVGLNAGAHYGSAKRWFPERFAQVADALIDSHGVQIALFGSAAESSLASRIAGLMRRPANVLAGRTSLQELKLLLSRCALLITNDSGPMHLAAALGTPLIAIFGSTDAVATPPLGTDVRIIRKEVACSPCLLRECPLDLRCFAAIHPDELICASREQLQKRLDAR